MWEGILPLDQCLVTLVQRRQSLAHNLSNLTLEYLLIHLATQSC